MSAFHAGNRGREVRLRRIQNPLGDAELIIRSSVNLAAFFAVVKGWCIEDYLIPRLKTAMSFALLKQLGRKMQSIMTEAPQML